MKNIQHVIFDLDGTIINSQEGIVNGLKYAFGKEGIEETEEKFIEFIGPPFQESFSDYGFDDEGIGRVIKNYRDYYSEKGINETRLYDGIEKTIKILHEKGYKIYLATSKPEVSAKIILENFGLTKFFTKIKGATLDGSISRKADVIKTVLDDSINIENSIMVGDREHDILGAKNFGMKSIGVLYGFGSHEEFENAGADYILRTPGGIVKLVESLNL